MEIYGNASMIYLTSIPQEEQEICQMILFFTKIFIITKLLINYLKNQFKNVDIFKFEEIFESYESMNNFLFLLNEKFNFKHKLKFSKKNFGKINSSFNNLELRKKKNY